jgi:hypothetical protein
MKIKSTLDLYITGNIIKQYFSNGFWNINDKPYTIMYYNVFIEI